MDNSKPSTRKPRPVEDWKRLLDCLIDKAAAIRHHGTIRIVLYEGEVRQVLVEKSIVDPVAELARDSTPHL